MQTPNHITILQEKGHEARVVSLDGRPHLDEYIQLWNGNARGRWEGETLLIETANFNPKNRFQGASENLQMVERRPGRRGSRRRQTGRGHRESAQR